MRQNTLANVLALLKAELTMTLNTSVTAADTELYTLIDNKQKFLAIEYDWPFLEIVADVTAAAQGRYLTLPTTLTFERAVEVTCLFSNHWQPVQAGITEREYNRWPSGDGSVTAQYSIPVQRWAFYGQTQFEIWPRPSQATTIRFRGQSVLTDLKSGGASYVAGALVDLDDLLIVLSVASDYLLMQKNPDMAQVKQIQASARLNRVRGNYPSSDGFIDLTGEGSSRPRVKPVPVLVA